MTQNALRDRLANSRTRGTGFQHLTRAELHRLAEYRFDTKAALNGAQDEFVNALLSLSAQGRAW